MVFLSASLNAGREDYIYPQTFAHIADHIIAPLKLVEDQIDEQDQVVTMWRGELLHTIRPDKVRGGDIIYLQGRCLDYFVSKIFSKIRQPFVLITHRCDKTMPMDCAAFLLNHKKLIAWFGMNMKLVHPKLHQIPLGSLSMYGHPKETEDVLSNGPYKKVHLLYMNHNIPQHKVFRPHVQERRAVFCTFCQVPFCYAPDRKPFDEYLMDLCCSKFVLSPRGAGQDCYRTWEALYAGAIPIVRRSFLDPLFEDLPVLIIDDWEEITEEFLCAKYEEIQARSYDWRKLSPEYWEEKIRSAAQSYMNP